MVIMMSVDYFYNAHLEKPIPWLLAKISSRGSNLEAYLNLPQCNLTFELT